MKILDWLKGIRKIESLTSNDLISYGFQYNPVVRGFIKDALLITDINLRNGMTLWIDKHNNIVRFKV